MEETCSVQDGTENSSDCLVIEGRLSLFLSNYNVSESLESQILVSIQSFMDDGLLDDCHPAVIKVTFLDAVSDIGLGNNVTIDDVVIENDQTFDIVFGGRTSWIAMSSGLSFVVCLIVITR